MTKRVIQFGTSRFLQAHADLFIHEARVSGQDIGPITVVKTTRGIERSGRISAFGREAGYPVIIRGIIDNKTVDKTLVVKSVDSSMVADRDWQHLIELFANDAQIVISNVGEGGYAISAEDRSSAPARGQVPSSFPAKLLCLLVARYGAGGKPMLVLPCELVSENGKALRQLLVDLARQWKLEDAFITWMASEITICDTLVDRIVSEAIEPVGAIAEPYALWAIKREASYDIPFTHPAVVVTEDLAPFMRLKLHILNLGHSFLAEIWQSEGRRPDETVREILHEPTIRKRLTDLYREEVIPGFAGHGMADDATAYVAATLDRFENPFLNHRLSDIAQSHRLKIDRRVVDFMAWVRTKNPAANLTKLQNLVSEAHGRGE